MLSRIRDILPWLAVAVLAGWGFWWAGHSRDHPVEDGRTEITWFVLISPLRDLYEADVAEFERLNPDIKVRVIWVPGSEYNAKLKILAAAGHLPDLFFTGDVWMSYLLPFKRDITDFVLRDAEEIGLDDYFPEIRAAMQLNGRYYILTEYMNLSLLYYNRRLFAEAAVPEPEESWTWDDYVRVGQALTQPGSTGKPGVWGSSRVEGWWGEWIIYVRQSGGDIFTADGRRCLLDSPEAINGLRFYLEKSTKYGISAPAGFEPINGFVNERVAMIVGGHVNYWLNYNQKADLDWDVQLLPKGPVTRKGGELAMAGYSVSKTSPHPEEAWRLAKFLTRPEAIARIVARGSLSVRRSVAEAQMRDAQPEDRPQNLAAAYRQFQYGQHIPRHSHYIEIMLNIVQPEVDRMLLGEFGPEEAGRRAAAAVNAFLATFDPNAP